MFYVEQIKNCVLTVHDKINFRANGSYYVDLRELRAQLKRKCKCAVLLAPYEFDLYHSQSLHVDQIKRSMFNGKTRYQLENQF